MPTQTSPRDPRPGNGCEIEIHRGGRTASTAVAADSAKQKANVLSAGSIFPRFSPAGLVQSESTRALRRATSGEWAPSIGAKNASAPRESQLPQVERQRCPEPTQQFTRSLLERHFFVLSVVSNTPKSFPLDNIWPETFGNTPTTMYTSCFTNTNALWAQKK